MASGKVRYCGKTIEPYYQGPSSTSWTDAKYKIHDIGACPVSNLLFSTRCHDNDSLSIKEYIGALFGNVMGERKRINNSAQPTQLFNLETSRLNG
jgi:hypothetical protein